jgi:hypothetical protein
MLDFLQIDFRLECSQNHQNKISGQVHSFGTELFAPCGQIGSQPDECEPANI